MGMFDRLFRKKGLPADASQEKQKPAPKKPIDIALWHEFHALEKYVRDKTEDRVLLYQTDEGEINYSALLTGLNANWIGKEAKAWVDYDAPIPLTDYDSADYHRYLKIDVPFDEEIRQKCPHFVGNATNLKDLIPPPIRNCMGVIAYYWIEGKADASTCQMALYEFNKKLKAGENPSSEEAVHIAKDYIEKKYILTSDIQALSEAIHGSPAVLGHIQESQLQGVPVKRFAGDKTALATALKTYQARLEGDTEHPPNAYLVQLIDYMRVGLERKTLSGDTVMHFLSDYHGDSKNRQLSKLPDGTSMRPPGTSYDLLMHSLKITQSIDHGQGWLSI